MSTGQQQDVSITGTVVPENILRGQIRTAQVQIVHVDGYVEEYINSFNTAQVQSVAAFGIVKAGEPPQPQPQQRSNIGGSGKYHGPHGIAVTADLLNGNRPVTEETQFNFFDQTDRSELERFLEIEPKPVEEDVDTSMSFLKSLPPPKVDTTMSFIKSLNQPKALIEKEVDPAMQAELDVLEEMKNAVLDNTLTEVIQPVAKPLTEVVQSDKFWKTTPKAKTLT